MNTAFFGDGPSQRGSVVKTAAAALACLFLAAAPVALAQEPAAPAPATDVDTSIPGMTPEAAPAEAAPAEAAAAEGGEAGDKEMEEVHNPFTVQAIWTEGDIVAKTTLIMMILMSAGSWYVVITKLFRQQQLFTQTKKLGAFWESSTIDEGLDQLGPKSSFRNIAESAIQAQGSGVTGLMSRIDRSDRMSHSVSQQVEAVNNDLAGGMAFLATVGSVSPFVGLFGTVWGIVNALIAIGLSGQASIDKVAGPVGEALIMTAIGLAVAVPAVIFYNLLGRRNKIIQDMARHFAVDVEQLLANSAKA